MCVRSSWRMCANLQDRSSIVHSYLQTTWTNVCVQNEYSRAQKCTQTRGNVRFANDSDDTFACFCTSSVRPGVGCLFNNNGSISQSLHYYKIKIKLCGFIARRKAFQGQRGREHRMRATVADERT